MQAIPSSITDWITMSNFNSKGVLDLRNVRVFDQK